MKDKHIAKLESHLENLIEGAFAHFFGRRIRAQDVALELVRAMEDGLRAGNQDDFRPFAPDVYEIRLSQQTVHHLREHQPNLKMSLSQHLVELATHAGYRLETPPVINIVIDDKADAGAVSVTASYMDDAVHSTNVMKTVKAPETHEKPRNAQLVIGNRKILLEKPIVNVGRSLDNHVVLEDTTVSRHHVQIRLRFGDYTLFDVRSRGGTLVNGTHIKEHTLRSGDVIQMGDTQLLYLQDDPMSGTTGLLKPVEPRDKE